MKKLIYCTILLILGNLVSGQELFIQNEDELKGSKKISGQEYTTVYDNTNHIYRYFNSEGEEIFLIKSFNEKGEQIPLSIEKNLETESLEIIVNNKSIGVLVNSIIYDLHGLEIGRFFRGERSKNNVRNFWNGVDYRYGNISIYDHTGLYKVGSFTFKEQIDYYAILGIEKIDNIEDVDKKIMKKKIRNIQRHYKKLLKKYNIKKYPNDTEIQEQFAEISNAYQEVMLDLGLNKKKDKKILGVIPQEYLSQERRSNWSQDEGYVPYTKRQLKDRDPDTKIQKDELYLGE